MRTIIKYFGVTLSLLILVSVLSCGKKTVSECQSKKIELLLEDLLKKRDYFPIYQLRLYNADDKNKKLLSDSSKYFGYLFSPNLKIPEKEFYMHWDTDNRTIYSDSVKLRVIKDLSEMGAGAFTVGIYPFEVNNDTTKLKIKMDHGIYSRADVSGIFTYSFDEKNCKWTVLDSTITYY